MSARLVPLVAMGACAIALASAGPAGACSCARESPRKELKRSDGAIIARLVEVRRLNRHEAEHDYLIRRVYKGRGKLDRGGVLTLASATDGAACGLPTRTGRRYGMFLDRHGSEWSASLCTLVGIRELRRAAEGDRRARKASRCESR